MIFHEEINERRELLLKSWPTSLREPCSRVAEVIDRDNKIPR